MIDIDELLELGIEIHIRPDKGDTTTHAFKGLTPDDKNITFSYYTVGPAGSMTLEFDENDIYGVLMHKNNIAAYLLGMTSEQHEEWLKNFGQVQCSATTVRGKRCKAVVPDTFQADAETFLRLQGAYCAIHENLGEYEIHKKNKKQLTFV